MIIKPKSIAYQLTAHGMPDHVFNTQQFDMKREIATVEVKGKPIHADRQIKAFQRTLDEVSGKYIFVMTGETHTRYAQVCAGLLMSQAIEHLKGTPIWYHMSSRDRVFDMLKEINRLSMFVLDGLVENSTPSRIERARDVLEYVTGICPIVVIGAGLDPITFMGKRLYLPVNRFLYFNERKKPVETL